MSAILATLVLLLPAQMQMDHGAMQNPPITLKTGIGPIHYKVSTKKPLAQKFFDQGLALTYGFHHNQAVRSFEEAARQDPNLAMAYWGEAYAMGPNINMPSDPDLNKQCYAVAQKALALESKASAKERMLIEALVKRYSNDDKPDLAKQDQAYADAMRQVAKTYPKDYDIQTLYAESLMDLRPWRLWKSNGEPEEGTMEIVAVLNDVLKHRPDHIGANHYLIHAVEASSHPEQALVAANRLTKLAPQSGHLVHMPSHIYIRTGQWEKAVESNDAALKTDERFLSNTPSPGIYPMYYVHNFDMYRWAANMQGNYAKSQWAAQNVGEKALGMGPMGEPFVVVPLLNQVRFRKWDLVKAASAPAVGNPLPLALYHFSKAMALAATSDVSGAEGERTACMDQVAKLTDAQMWGLTPGAQIMAVSDSLLDAAICRAKADKDGEIAALQKAVQAADQIGYNEPPDYFFPVRESLGGALLRAGRAAEAEETFRADLKQNPGNGRSLFGLWKALEMQRKPAEQAKLDFEKAWTHADVTLTVEDL